MRLFTISAFVALFALNAVNMANASEIRVYDVKDLVKLPNVVNTEHAIKQRIELEAKLLQWRIAEPLRDITRLPSIQSIPPLVPMTPSAPAAKSAEQKAAEWRVIECQRFNRCE